MKQCISEKEFNLFIEDQISTEEMVRIEEHSKACAACSAELESWKQLKASLNSASEIEIPETLKGRVMEQVKKEKILSMPEPIGIRRILAVSVLGILIAGYYLMPVLFPFATVLIGEVLTYISTAFYNALNFIGLDMKSVMGMFRVSIEIFNQYFWVFATSTILLVVGFFTIILMGRTKLKAN